MIIVLHVNVIMKTTLLSLSLPPFPIIRSFFQAFAVNLDIILTNNKARLNPFGPGGHLEPEFLSTITTVPELEAKADNCTKVHIHSHALEFLLDVKKFLSC